jgi:hypothetical protein
MHTRDHFQAKPWRLIIKAKACTRHHIQAKPWRLIIKSKI